MSTADTMNPIQTIQNTIFAISTSAVGISATRSISLAPLRSARRSKSHPREQRWIARRATSATTNPPAKMIVRGDEPRHEQHERRGEVAPRLDERIGDFLNHRDLTPPSDQLATSAGFSR